MPTQTFSFNGTSTVPSPDTLVVTQVGTSPFNLLTWTRNVTPDGWVIRRDEQVVYSAVATDPQFVLDALGNWTWIDYTATGGQKHHYRVSAKVGGVTSDRDPSYDVLYFPTGIWLGDPYRRTTVLLRGADPGQWTQGETSAVYYPLRGTDPIRVTQSQRGYEGTLSGFIRSPSDGNVSDGTATDNYRALQHIRDFPSRQYVVALPHVAFYATLSNITPAPADDIQERWDVSLTFEQQGVSLWRSGGDAVASSATLLNTYTYEEGVAAAAVTTSSPGVTSTSGAPVYKTTAAVHGAMGWGAPAAANGGALLYDIPYVGMASVYVTPRTSSGAGSALKLLPSGSGTVAEVNLRTGGDLDISDSAGATVAKSHGTAGWVANATMRLDVAWTWSTGTITVTVRIYSSPESQTPADEFTGTFAATNAPLRLSVGPNNAAKSTDYDTLRIYAGNATWANAFLYDPNAAQVQWALPGVGTPTTMTVASNVLGAKTIDLAYSTTLSGNDPATPTYAGAATIDANGLVRHNLTGLTAGTVYYAKLATTPGAFAGDLIQWRQLPASTGAFTVKVAVGSCQRNANGSTSQLAWTDALAFAPDQHWHLGDFGYWGNGFKATDDWKAHVAQYTTALTKLPAMRQALQRSNLVLLADDHEFSDNNRDSNSSVSPWGKNRADSILAMQNAFSMYPLADGAAPANKRGLYGSFMLGAHVRVIVLDGESLDRSLGTDTDTGTAAAPWNTIPKTFAGTAQDAWLRTTLTQNAAVNLIVTGKALLGTSAAVPDIQNADKPFNYGKWRDTLKGWIGANTQANGLPIKICWIGGDRHANGVVSGANNLVTPGHPSIVASGYEQHGLPVQPGENWDSSYGYDPTKALTRVQYVRLTIADNGTNTITLTYLSRQSQDQGLTIVDGGTATFTFGY